MTGVQTCALPICLLESKELMEHYYNMSQRVADYHVGDLVFLREEGVLPKHAMRWSEPFRVQAIEKKGCKRWSAPGPSKLGPG